MDYKWGVIMMATNLSLNESKLENIKLHVLEAEMDNIVKKESNAAMVDKIRKIIEAEVDKR